MMIFSRALKWNIQDEFSMLRFESGEWIFWVKMWNIKWKNIMEQHERGNEIKSTFVFGAVVACDFAFSDRRECNGNELRKYLWVNHLKRTNTTTHTVYTRKKNINIRNAVVPMGGWRTLFHLHGTAHWFKNVCETATAAASVSLTKPTMLYMVIRWRWKYAHIRRLKESGVYWETKRERMGKCDDENGHGIGLQQTGGAEPNKAKTSRRFFSRVSRAT